MARSVLWLVVWFLVGVQPVVVGKHIELDDEPMSGERPQTWR